MFHRQPTQHATRRAESRRTPTPRTHFESQLEATTRAGRAQDRDNHKRNSQGPKGCRRGCENTPGRSIDATMSMSHDARVAQRCALSVRLASKDRFSVAPLPAPNQGESPAGRAEEAEKPCNTEDKSHPSSSSGPESESSSGASAHGTARTMALNTAKHTVELMAFPAKS